MDFSIKAQQDGCYQLQGELDLASVAEAERMGQQCIDSIDKSQSSMVFDLSGIQLSDSVGIALLIAWLRHASMKNIKLQYIKIPQRMLDIARVNGVDAILPLNVRG